MGIPSRQDWEEEDTTLHEQAEVLWYTITYIILYICLGENNDYLISTSCLVDNINYLGEKKIKKCTAKFRYRQKDIPVELEWIDEEILVKYPQGVKAVTPGQACVFYKDDECLGGGIIKEVRKNDKKLWYL